MKVLNSPPAAPAPTATPATDACPKCQKPLTDPNGLGWCPACGYCRSLEETRAQAPPAQAPVQQTKSRGDFIEFCGYVARMPRWVWILFGGMVLFALFSFVVGRYLRMTPLERALLSTIQIVFGLALIFGAQFWSLVRLAPEDERLSTKDAFLPAKLWAMAFQRMPAFQVPVWLAGWGLAIILSAIFLVGGLTHWGTYLPGQKPAETKQNR